MEALHEEPAAWGRSDEDVLERAATDHRIVVTRNGRDFIALARAWAEEERTHAGILVLWGLRSAAFGEIAEAIANALEAHPDQDTWTNLVLPA